MLVPGLLQTPEYARALFRAWILNVLGHEYGGSVVLDLLRSLAR
jgi:hypothetical protein